MTNQIAGPDTVAEVAGVRVDLTPRLEVLSRLREALDGPNMLCAVHTLNPEILMCAFRSREYASILSKGAFNVVDGVGLQMALRHRLGVKVSRICGSDLIFDLAEIAENAGRVLFLLGGQPGRLELAKAKLRRHYPRLQVEGLSPQFTPGLPLREQSQIEDMMKCTQPGVVALFLGAPRQETWIAQNRALLAACNVSIAAGLGGTVDFLSGEVARAPNWIRSGGFEWAFRLAKEPQRLKRQASSLPEFALRAMFSRRFARLRPTMEGDRE